MNFPKQYYDSSSDDSDVIPPTPAAKSTPLVQGDRFRTQSTSSSASSNRGVQETPRISTRSPAGNDSSSEDEDDDDVAQGTPMARAGSMKREPTTNSSSDEDHSNAIKNQIMARIGSNQQKRPVHSMSDSEDSDTDGREADTSIAQNHHRQEDESSEEESDDDGNSAHTSTVAVKLEKPSASESSEESEDEANYRGNVNARFNSGQSSEESESEDENPRHPHKSQNIVSKADESMGLQDNDSSNEESDEEVEEKPVTTKLHQAPTNNSSSESESEEEAQLRSIMANSQNRKVSEGVSSEDDEATSISRLNNKSRKDSSDEESSEDENMSSKTQSAQSKRQDLSSNQQNVYYDSSEDEASDKLGEEVEQKVNPIHIPKSIAEQMLVVSKSTSRQESRAAVPDSGHKGMALLKETFAKDKILQVDNAPLTVEDIGSDEEIWLLQCPRSMDISALKKRTINLSSENDIQIEDGPAFKRFSITPQKNINNSINCLLPHRSRNQFQISCLPVKGKIVINEHIHVPKLRLPEASSKGPVPFPTGLKVRHPLLGTGYKKHIAEAKKSLEEGAIRNKQASKKKKHSSENGYSDHRGSFDLSSQYNGKKKRSAVSDELNISNINNDGSSKKKKKLSLNVNDSDDSGWNKSDGKKHKTFKQQSILEGSVNETYVERASSKKDKSSSMQNSLSSLQNDNSLDVSSKKKKKSKRENEGNLSDMGIQHSWHIPQKEEMPVKAVSNNDSHSKKKSKKHSKDLLNPLEIKQENLDTSGNGTSEMPNNEAKAKKRKRKEVDQDSAAIDPQTPSKKKKYYL